MQWETSIIVSTFDDSNSDKQNNASNDSTSNSVLL